MTKPADVLISAIRHAVPEGFVPLHAPEFHGQELNYLQKTIESTFVSSVGEYVEEFERHLARVTQSQYAVAVSNGTVGLHVLMHALGVGEGDAVITQSLTFVATCNAILQTGAEPILLDSDADTYGLSASELSRYLNECTERDSDGVLRSKQSGRRIAAVLPMHVFGHAVDIDAINKVAAEFALPVIEDAAEALGSVYQDRAIGSHSLASVFSFNGNKILTTGGGGAITTKDEQLAKRLKALTTTAKQPHAYEFVHDEMAFNYRMPNLNAALGCAQLEQLETRLAKKQALHSTYAALFADHNIEMLRDTNTSRSNHWLNNVLLDSFEERENFLKQTNAEGIQTRPFWKPMHMTKFLSGCERGTCPMATSLYERVVSIPSSAVLGDLL